MAQYQTYASLGDLITANDFPESLRFLGDGLSSLLEDIYYQNFILARSADGASFSLEIELLLGDKLGIEIPGTGGFRLIFNPDATPGSPLSVLPLNFYFSLGILRYISLFDPASFSFTPQSVFDLVLKIFNINGVQLLDTLASNFIDAADPLEAFAIQANTHGAGISLPLNPDREIALSTIVSALVAHNISLRQIIFEDYLLGLVADLEAFWFNISRLFSSFVNVDLKEEVEKLLVPYVYASIALSLGLEIPRSVLLPMKPDGSGGYEVEEDENIKTTLIFDAGEVYYDSREGNIGFDDDFQLHFKAPHDKAQITGTPLTIHFENARYRMVRTDGTGSSSVYRNVLSIDEVEIGLPSIFEGNSGNPAIVGRNIVFDSETGFSGIIGIEGNGNLQYTFVNGLTIELVSFDVTFTEGSVTGSSIHGTITIPSFQYNPLDIEITLEDGFLIKVMVPSTAGLPIINNNNVLITLNGLEIGRQDTVWRLGFAAHFTMKRELPLLSKIFPKQFDINQFLFKSDGSQLEYNFHIEWLSGAVIEGDDQTGVTGIFPVHIDIGDGLFKIDNIKLVMTKEPDNSGMNFDILLQGVGFNFGPLLGSIDGFGAHIDVENAGSGSANLGPFNVGLSFIGPQGVGVQIKSNVLTGGGYLYIGDGEYIGALSLTFKEKIGINALGILTTKLPGGQSGYSLLVILTVEFGPLPLGMGFTLNGLGGLLGLHRTMNPDVLRSGIRDNTLDYILFPQDIIGNAKTIISNIGNAFPVQKGQFLIGPMAKIGWGTPTLLTIELGIIIELPEPVRLAILGVVKALLPSKDNAIVKIQVNFLGIIDFTNKYLSFDASLYDSQILTFGLFGDMALRLYWGDKPNFLLSVGGFHPKFTPPPLNLPELRRLTIVLANQDNLKISVETYFAVTSNSVQFGAKVAAMAKAWKIQAIGALWFDILFQFSPFYFIADMGVMFAIKMGSKTILSLYVELTLEGPSPWRARGKGSFKILFVRVNVSFDKTFGQARVEAIQAEAIDAKVKAALTNRDNWEATIPARNSQMVNWLEEDPSDPGTELSVDPAGSLKISQRLLPFETTMAKFGSSAISDFKRYDITGVMAGTNSLPTQIVRDYFARNEFFYMTDDEKLSRPSYELFDSGVIAGADQVDAQYAVHYQCHYEQVTLDSGYRRPEPRFILTANLFLLHRFGNYISRSVLSDFERITTSAGPNRVRVDLQEQQFVVVDRNYLNPVSTYFNNSLDAQQFLDAQLASNPAGAADWIVANRFEL